MFPYFNLRLIYYVFVSFLAIAVLTVQVQIYRHARQNKIDRILRWSIPGLVNGLLATMALIIDDIYIVMNLRETAVAYIVNLALSATNMIFCLVSVQRLWEMVKTMPSTGSASESTPQETNAWPPAPAPPQ